MTHKITPQQAFEAAKVLWPSLSKIRRQVLGFIIRFDDRSIVTVHGSQIDWPEGVTEWPMPERKWRDAKMPEDYGKEARFSNNRDQWKDGYLCGRVLLVITQWICHNGIHWNNCQVRDDSPEVQPSPPVTAGEGWRLLNRDEVIQKGDEFWSIIHESPGRWNSYVSEGSTPRKMGHVYRRKIEVQP